jgi:hypothetical protein
MRVIDKRDFEIMVKITYKGEVFVIPEEAKYLAIDEDGALYYHKGFPRRRGREWFSPDYEFIAQVCDFGDWKETLEEV